MAQRQTNQKHTPVFRLDAPDAIDLQELQSRAAAPQRGAWRHLEALFNTAFEQHCVQFSVEPDASMWRIRYRCIDGYHECIATDPSDLIWALDTLQVEVWGDTYHTKKNRQHRFALLSPSRADVIMLRVLPAVNGDVLQFDIEPLRHYPATVEELGLTPSQLNELRTRLGHNHAMVLLTSSEPLLLHDTLLSINQMMISPDRQLLSVSERHRYSLPRTNQVEINTSKPKKRIKAWQRALSSHHTTLLVEGHVPSRFHEQIADNCDNGVLAIQAVQTARSHDLLASLNAGVIRRTPLQRTVTTVVNHYPVRCVCPHCASIAQLDAASQQWLEKLRTPATENVISWLADGNKEQFMSGEGCEKCSNTGFSAPTSVYDIIHRNNKSNLFSVADASTTADVGGLQRRLMSLAKEGRIPLSEVIRVLTASQPG